jgi:hypothetical protein
MENTGNLQATVADMRETLVAMWELMMDDNWRGVGVDFNRQHIDQFESIVKDQLADVLTELRSHLEN